MAMLSPFAAILPGAASREAENLFFFWSQGQWGGIDLCGELVEQVADVLV